MEETSSNYHNLTLMGDFNVEPTEIHKKDFSLTYNETCYKNPENPKCIDPIITNMPKPFQNSQEVETGLPDFHKIYLPILKFFYTKQKPHIIQY